MSGLAATALAASSAAAFSVTVEPSCSSTIVGRPAIDVVLAGEAVASVAMGVGPTDGEVANPLGSPCRGARGHDEAPAA
jgi:hypothetical protein